MAPTPSTPPAQIGEVRESLHAGRGELVASVLRGAIGETECVEQLAEIASDGGPGGYAARDLPEQALGGARRPHAV